MAIIKRICGPRRVVLAASLGEDASIRDEAMAPDMDIKAYTDSLYDPELVKLQDGADPVWWTIKPLTRRQKDALEQHGTTRGKMWHYVRCSLTAVDGYYLQSDDGAKKQVELKTAPEGRLGELLTEETLDVLDLDDQTLLGLMLMIRTISEATAPLSHS